jgi:glycosyltransferase involved in cell wall biosynthesis
MNGRHVVIVSRALPFHSLGGMQAVAWDLATQFVSLGLRVTCITTRIPDRPARFEHDGVRVVALAETTPERYSRAWWRGSRAVFAAELLGKVDYVLSVSAGAYGLLPLRARLPNVPFVFQAHGTSVGEIVSKFRSQQPKAWLSSVRNMFWLVRDMLAYRDFDAVVAVGDAVATALRSAPLSWVLPDERTRTIQNGVDEGQFVPDPVRRTAMRNRLGWQSGERVVVSVSRLHAQKGLRQGLQAFAVLAAEDSDLRYLIVGDGPERAGLQQLAASLGIAEQVHFAGAMDRDRIPEYLQAADAFLFTTLHSEGLPLNVLEALAAGVPCVVSNHLQRVIAISPAIVGADPQDARAVSAALRLALQRGRACESLLPEQYTLGHCARAYCEVFASLAHV